MSAHPGIIGLVWSVLAVIPISSHAQEQLPAMTPVDFVELPRLGKPAMSPDGLRVVYKRKVVLWDDNDTVSRIHIVNIASGESEMAIDPIEEDESFGDVVWRGDSEGFITLLKRNESETKQAYYYQLSDESVSQMTSQTSDIEDIAWSPDDAGFYFLSERQEPAAIAKDIDNDWVIAPYESEPMHQLWYFDLEKAMATRVLGGDFDVRGYSVARDGGTILYSRTDHTLGDRQDSELWLYDTASRKTRRLTDNTFAEYDAVLSPGDSKLAYIATVNERGEHYYEDNIFVMDVESGSSRLLLADVPMEILDIEWAADKSGLFLLGNSGLQTQLYYIDIVTEKLTALTTGNHEVLDWTYDSTSDAHVFLLRDATSPGEVWRIESGSGDVEQLTYEFGRFSDTYSLPRQVPFRWRGRDGTALEGLLVYPLNHKPGAPFPLVTITHGGPRSSSQFGSWNMSRYVPVLAGEGYGIFLPNHRGGTGYGDLFMRDMVGNYFNNAHLDVLDGIDALVDAKLADSEKLVKMGWSAGGHMTNKLITSTDRFKVASSGAGASDWVSMYAESDVRFSRTFWFGGTPWQRDAPLKSFSDQSLLKDTWRISTPTLFFVGEDDVRVPPTQSIMMYQGAKAAGVETKLYIAPGEPHNYGDPKHRLFKINTELEWFARHLGRVPYVPVFPAVKEQVEQVEQ